MRKNEKRIADLEARVAARAEAERPPELHAVDLGPGRIAEIRDVFRGGVFLEGIGPESTDAEVDEALARMRGLVPAV